ncbi:hypothetical protein KIN20_031462 [Parelaphostrongylus tenuis]|uniref:Uncharacterized protein n=1 Tax=Parelaphostrongylus tenuis TaxID=148309 RepID=A0AAD5WH08_PARTN|nr:hypothetical protein KIN20_031462 [Parelaphostrongylus tenuis]
MTGSLAYSDEVYCYYKDVDMGIVGPMETGFPSSPAHVTVADEEDDKNDDLTLAVPKQTKKKCCSLHTVTAFIDDRRIQYSISCADGVLKMIAMDSWTNDASADYLTATNTASTASFNLFDRIKTLKIIRSPETGQLDWIAMIRDALDAIASSNVLPVFVRVFGSSSDCQRCNKSSRTIESFVKMEKSSISVGTARNDSTIPTS